MSETQPETQLNELPAAAPVDEAAVMEVLKPDFAAIAKYIDDLEIKTTWFGGFNRYETYQKMKAVDARYRAVVVKRVAELLKRNTDSPPAYRPLYQAAEPERAAETAALLAKIGQLQEDKQQLLGEQARQNSKNESLAAYAKRLEAEKSALFEENRALEEKLTAAGRENAPWELPGGLFAPVSPAVPLEIPAPFAGAPAPAAPLEMLTPFPDAPTPPIPTDLPAPFSADIPLPAVPLEIPAPFAGAPVPAVPLEMLTPLPDAPAPPIPTDLPAPFSADIPLPAVPLEIPAPFAGAPVPAVPLEMLTPFPDAPTPPIPTDLPAPFSADIPLPAEIPAPIPAAIVSPSEEKKAGPQTRPGEESSEAIMAARRQMMRDTYNF